MAELLQVKDLKVSVEEKQILKGINLTINKGEIHVVMGDKWCRQVHLGQCYYGESYLYSGRGFYHF